MDFGFEDLVNALAVWTLPVLFAVTLHEAAHGWVALKLGDNTALRLGRVTFNPFRHVDPVGTVLMPIMILFLSGGRMMFGYAKPVPVNFSRLRMPRRDMALVAAAGPAANILMAVIAASLFHVLPLLPADFAQFAQLNLRNALWLNLILCVFNLLPIPPLDGGRVAVALLPSALGRRLARLERYGFLIILGAMFILPMIGGTVGLDLDVFRWLVAYPAEALARLIGTAVGIM